MSVDIQALSDAVHSNGPVVRVTIAAVAGSAPREIGASMLVWEGDQSGTIGGGALEFDAAKAARRFLSRSDPQPTLDKIPLGPTLGQCCGGTVSLLTERVTQADCVIIQDQIDRFSAYARPVQNTAIKPLSIQRLLANGRAGTDRVTATLLDGWFIEPAVKIKTPLWIFGAGHVGRAIVHAFGPLAYDITWIDTAKDRFPKIIPGGVTQLIAKSPADLVKFAPDNAAHLVLTYSHALDLEICHQLLNHSFSSAGLIGSKTKWTRFRKRLGQLDHSTTQILRIDCPIGDPALGKAPESIAIGVASALLLKSKAAEISIIKEEDLARDYTT